MKAIIELASRLGKAIAESPQAAKLRAAKDELEKHAEVKQILTDYNAQAEKVAKLEAEGKTIEVDDKHRLQELQDSLVSNEVFKQYTAAQVDYVDLHRAVNAELRKQLGETET